MLCNALRTKAFSVGTRSDERRILASLVVTRYASDCQCSKRKGREELERYLDVER